MNKKLLIAGLCLSSVVLLNAFENKAPKLTGNKEKIDFNMQVRPILSDKCFFCHGPDKDKREAKLRLDLREDALKALKSGDFAITPGSLEKSELHYRIMHTDPDEIMPPPESKISLTKKEKAILNQWILEGAEYKDHWAFIPLRDKIEVPSTTFKSGRTEVDFFIQRKLKKLGLKPAVQADKETLLRRVSFTLTGLPPTPEEIKAFKNDTSSGAYEKVVDRLLKSDACAERLTVDWMDYARFADSYGYQRDNFREMTVWRDWVIKAFQNNMGYDDFITRQLAGDLIKNPTEQSILATAFNRLHMQKNEGGSIPEEFRVEYVADRTHTASNLFLGLTFECSRCHDHKYDPITMEDYYSMFAFFNNIDEAGLYPYFNNSTPTPKLKLVGNATEGLLKAKSAVEKNKADLQQSQNSKSPEFKAWQKTWDNKIEAKGVLNKAFKKQTVSGDSQISIGHMGELNRQQPFSFSIKFKAPTSYERAVMAHRSRAWTDAASQGYELLVVDGRYQFALVHFDPGNAIRIESLDKMAINKWQTVTVSYDGSSKASGLKLYLDGQVLKSKVINDNLTNTIGNKMVLHVGARMRDLGFKKAAIENFYFYDHALTSAEVKTFNGQSTETLSEAELQEYFLTSVSKKHKELLTKLKTARAAYFKKQQGFKDVMVMKEMTQHRKRKTYVLTRGSYEAPDKKREVQPRGISRVYDFGKFEKNRLGFSKWLTDPNHPLTARVTVNRFWQQVFGVGIVTTTNDFGAQGKIPSHLDLLDWLSRRFISSGWDVKALLKTMVMSHSFRQDSKIVKDQFEKDMKNTYLSRGPASHLTAEMIRDNALASAGMLNRKVGGRSANKDNNRRSLYTLWKRNNPPPDMLLFGAPTREVCSVKREKTSTPLQALVLLNGPQFVEASRAIADRALSAHPDDEAAAITKIFLLLTGREPGSVETTAMNTALKEQKAYFEKNPKIASSFLAVGKYKSKNKKIKAPTLAAWTVLANMVMNLDASFMLR